MSFVSNNWKKIITIGDDPTLRPFDRRILRLVNGILATGEILFLLLILKSFLTNVPVELLIHIIGALIFPIPILLNALKKYESAKTACLIIPYLYLASITVFWGSGRGSQLIILPCMALSVMFFENKYKTYLMIALGALALITVEVYTFGRIPYYVTAAPKVAYVINLMITITLLIVTATIYKAQIIRYLKSIYQKNEQITSQHDKLLILNKNLKESINIIEEQTSYAKLIQETILPPGTEINEVLPNHFVFFKPKDVVSGDFYFFENINGKVFLAAVDCTGHGVPGAFMSMIGYNLLSEAIELKQIEHPSEILDYLKTRIIHSLRQHKTENKDGMDIALCMIDKGNRVLEYAGAKNSMILIHNNHLEKIDADRMTIGGFIENEVEKFTNHSFNIEPGMSFYLYTDGYPDQFGGAGNKKYMKKRLNELLMDISAKEIDVQKREIAKSLIDWKKDNEQTDDILVIGVKL